MSEPQATLKIFLQGGGDDREVNTPLDIKSTEFLQELVIALNLGATDAEGQPINWIAVDKDTGKTLTGEKTLAENGVQSGHRLSIFRETVAGGRARGRGAKQ
jgi:hypothetical protein